MTDNAQDMVGEKSGLLNHFKSQNNSIYSFGCICHKINLVLVNLFKVIDGKIKMKLKTLFLKNF